MIAERRKLLARLALAAAILLYGGLVAYILVVQPAAEEERPQAIEIAILPREDEGAAVPEAPFEPDRLDEIDVPFVHHPRVDLEQPRTDDSRPTPPGPRPPRIEPPARPPVLAMPPDGDPTPEAFRRGRFRVMAAPAGPLDEPIPWADPTDELWIIARPEPQATAAAAAESPGTGSMVARVPSVVEQVAIPLKDTRVRAGISGYIATVEVTQRFQNPFREKIEAVYVFPLPQNAAVHEFLMTIGTRRIRGIIREREEAERIYAEARSLGYRAALLSQERPNLFTQRIANIEPHKTIKVEIQYFHTLAYVDGWHEFVFPMAIGPRFNPPGASDGVGAVARGKTDTSGQPTEVEYLRPAERSGRDITLSVAIDAGVPIEEVTSTTHAVTTRPRPTPSQTVVNLNHGDQIPNRDFVLRYRVAGDRLKSTLLTSRDRHGDQFFTLLLYPPARLEHLHRHPMEMVFVLDRSGSMTGDPIAKAKQALDRALRRLGPDDTFQIIHFADRAARFVPAAVPASADNVEQGLRYMRGLRAGGGTMLLEGLKAALDVPPDPQRTRFVVFLTDGFIGNDFEVLAHIQRRLGPSRLFSFGIGSAPNRYLLEGMARLGKGAVAYVALEDDAKEVLDCFFDRVSHPALTHIAIDWGSLRVRDVYPKRIPDLYLGRPVVLTGRLEGRGGTTIRIRGRAGTEAHEVRVKFDPSAKTPPHKAVPLVWAQAYIADLTDQAIQGGDEALWRRITLAGLRYGLVTLRTDLLIVDASEPTQGSRAKPVHVPVVLPRGVGFRHTIPE